MQLEADVAVSQTALARLKNEKDQTKFLTFES